jgi:NAD-dependent deacetylase
MVSPANTIPSIAKRNGAVVIEINKERTHLTDSITDIFLEGSASSIVKALVDDVKRILSETD